MNKKAVEQFKKSNTVTAQYLRDEVQIEIPKKRRTPSDDFIRLTGAKGNNLKGVDLNLPLGCLVAVTGVSGSGKSTLINETLFPLAHSKIYGSHYKVLHHDSISGLEHIDKVIRIDQSPIGRTPRSNAPLVHEHLPVAAHQTVPTRGWSRSISGCRRMQARAAYLGGGGGG